MLKITIRRLELLLESIEIKETDETSYNELEKILSELNTLNSSGLTSKNKIIDALYTVPISENFKDIKEELLRELF